MKKKKSKTAAVTILVTEIIRSARSSSASDRHVARVSRSDNVARADIETGLNVYNTFNKNNRLLLFFFFQTRERKKKHNINFIRFKVRFHYCFRRVRVNYQQ